MTLIPEADQRDLLIYAFRYTLGRQTYAPHTVIAVLKQCWKDLSDGDRMLYKREIHHAIETDQAGSNYDRQAWQSILDLHD